ncbi:hypothetical protein HU200_031119 [Digitaria exilis]|uniref:Uncharacterized protein n=1 Tax=Digitaria exilis TaxID=1010633 RepID=A0A835EQ20_9POAL|nr:hypothetical protein HU200_031119 [Digitaria exilis]
MEESLQLKQEGGSKVFSKLFTRESSAAAPSFRVYYGVASAGSVPFMWESQPGTPKNDAISTATLPPLTPPPSYYTAAQSHRRSSDSAVTSGAGGGKKHSTTKQYMSFLSTILPKIILHRRRSGRSSSSSSGSPSAASSCSSSSSSSAFSSSASVSFRSAQSPAACSSMRRRVYAFSVGDAGDGEEEEERPAATCFSGVRHESFRAFKGSRVAMTVKSALASVGGHGHGPTAATGQKV